MTFEEYLVKKRIDSAAFRRAEPDHWDAWNSEFQQIHPGSFTTQKLYLINPVRRKYPLKEVAADKPVDLQKPAGRPKPVVPRPKMG